MFPCTHLLSTYHGVAVPSPARAFEGWQQQGSLALAGANVSGSFPTGYFPRRPMTTNVHVRGYTLWYTPKHFTWRGSPHPLHIQFVSPPHCLHRMRTLSHCTGTCTIPPIGRSMSGNTALMVSH